MLVLSRLHMEPDQSFEALSDSPTEQCTHLRVDHESIFCTDLHAGFLPRHSLGDTQEPRAKNVQIQNHDLMSKGPVLFQPYPQHLWKLRDFACGTLLLVENHCDHDTHRRHLHKHVFLLFCPRVLGQSLIVRCDTFWLLQNRQGKDKQSQDCYWQAVLELHTRLSLPWQSLDLFCHTQYLSQNNLECCDSPFQGCSKLELVYICSQSQC